MTKNESTRAAAVGRIRALLAKTVRAGATQAEALSAAAKAAELMDRYTLSMSDIEIRQEKAVQHKATDKRHPADNCVGAIAALCSCRAWFRGGRPVFFGMATDVEVAKFLMDLIRNALESEFRAYMRTTERPVDRYGSPIHGRSLRASFMYAMSWRISARLREMVKARETSHHGAGSGRDLVAVKNEAVESQYADLGLKLRSRSSSVSFRTVDSATTAGKTAGDRVNLTTGIGSGGTSLRINRA